GQFEHFPVPRFKYMEGQEGVRKKNTRERHYGNLLGQKDRFVHLSLSCQRSLGSTNMNRALFQDAPEFRDRKLPLGLPPTEVGIMQNGPLPDEFEAGSPSQASNSHGGDLAATSLPLKKFK